jgi:hypothetical protein
MGTAARPVFANQQLSWKGLVDTVRPPKNGGRFAGGTV